MSLIDLSKKTWILEGWRPFAWKLGRSREGNGHIIPDIGPLAAKAPGSVQEALRQSGLVPDWNEGVNSRLCEWVEHRHWYFETVLCAEDVRGAGPFVLEANGLDYSGWIIVDGIEAGRFEGALIPHRFDLTPFLTPGGDTGWGSYLKNRPENRVRSGTRPNRDFSNRVTITVGTGVLVWQRSVFGIRCACSRAPVSGAAYGTSRQCLKTTMSTGAWPPSLR